MGTRVKKQIFIATCSYDEATVSPVAKELGGRGYNVVVYKSDKVAEGEVRLDVKVTGKSGLVVQYDGHRLDPQRIGAAWFRKPHLFEGEQLTDKARFLSLVDQRQRTQRIMWDMIPDAVWLNSANRITAADRKIDQLLTARTLGFNIPDTIITNSWETIRDSLPENTIFKSFHPRTFREDKAWTTYTTPVNNPKDLPLKTNPFPGMWQPHLKKAREWRITVVGEQSFDAAVHTVAGAKDDWRRHQDDEKKVQFKKETFPSDQKELCFKYLQAFGLRYGAFDFIEDPDGKIIFLECNPNGQYGWLEHFLGFPISQAIADELIKISETAAA